MDTVIEVAVVEDNRMFAEALRTWAREADGIRLAALVCSAEELLRSRPESVDVVLLDPTLRAEPDAAFNVRRLIAAGHRVLVVDGSSEQSAIAPVLAAGAHGYLTRDHDLAGLAATVRAIAHGATAWSAGPTSAAAPDGRPRRPSLSRQEHLVLMAYVSGMTLESVARRLGISPATAHTYLKRVKAKYRQAGALVATKLELAQQVRADCAAGTCPAARTSLAEGGEPLLIASGSPSPAVR